MTLTESEHNGFIWIQRNFCSKALHCERGGLGGCIFDGMRNTGIIVHNDLLTHCSLSYLVWCVTVSVTFAQPQPAISGKRDMCALEWSLGSVVQDRAHSCEVQKSPTAITTALARYCWQGLLVTEHRYHHIMPLDSLVCSVTSLNCRFFLGTWNMKGFLSEERPIRTLREVLQRLRESYCGKIGYEVRTQRQTVSPGPVMHGSSCPYSEA